MKLYHCFAHRHGDYQPNEYIKASTEGEAIAEFICTLARHNISHTGEVYAYEIGKALK